MKQLNLFYLVRRPQPMATGKSAIKAIFIIKIVRIWIFDLTGFKNESFEIIFQGIFGFFSFFQKHFMANILAIE